MVYIQHRKNRTPVQFLKDRIERIAPLYWFLTLSMAVLLIILPSAFGERTFDLVFLVKSLFFVNFLSNLEPLLYVGWTLEYEMLFYLIFALSLFAKNEKASLLICATALSFLVMLGLNSIIIEFIFGMIIGYVFNNHKIQINNLICIAMIILGFGFLTINWNSDLSRSITWGIPSVLIFLGFLLSKPLKNKVFQSLGNASYSIYLVQVFSIPIFYKIIDKLAPDFSYSAEIYIILCLIFTVIAGVALHLIIEKPLNYLIVKKTLPKRNHLKVL